MSLNLSFNTEITRPLPAHHGYAMGSIVHKGISLYPPLIQEMVTWEATANKCESLISNLSSKDGDHEGMSRSERESKVTMMNQEKKRADERVAYFKARIEALPPFELGDGQQMLPIDFIATRQKSIKRAFESEQFSQRFISRDTLDKRKGGVVSEVQQTLKNIKISEIGIEPPVSGETVENISKEIEMLVNEEKEVHLIGAFISLPRSNVMDPIVLRKEAVSQELIRNAHKYLVITEVLLGAYFIGYEEMLSHSATSNTDGGKNSSSSKMLSKNCSFHAQGSISTTPISSTKDNLLDVYNNWKKRLIEDPESGYPIATKVRDLTEIMKENKINVPES